MATYVEACECGSWHLELQKADGTGEIKRVPFTCRSWRHAGPCRLWKGAQDFVRIAAALSAESRWVYLVLTFAQNDWDSPWAQYKAAGRCWGALLKRMQRAYGIAKYVQTWERFRKGGAHANVCIWNPAIIAAVETDWRAWRRDWLTPNAVAVGFGKRTWCEVIASGTTRIAGYFAKLSRELTGSGKDYQIPVDAPPHFRRLRASHHTLPPVHKGDMTGRLVQLPLPRRE